MMPASILFLTLVTSMPVISSTAAFSGDELKRIDRAVRVARKCAALPFGMTSKIHYAKAASVSVASWGWLCYAPRKYQFEGLTGVI